MNPVTNSVLVWGLSEDGPTARVAEELKLLSVPIAWVEQQQLREYRIELELGVGAGGRLEGPEGSFDLGTVQGAYLRPYDFRSLEVARELRQEDVAYRDCVFAEEALRSWAEATRAPVMNRFSAMASNGSKPFQAELIRRQGFAVPETLITSDPEAAGAFWAKHGSVVYKSMSGRRSIVGRLVEGDRERLERVAACPTQFQKWIPGIDYRAHVVGDQVFGCRVQSNSTDYRYDAGTNVEAAELPDEISERCYRLTRALGLELGGVDLRQTPEGEWYCFEVNPSPGFSYYEEATGLPIAAAIASTLASRCTC